MFFDSSDTGQVNMAESNMKLLKHSSNTFKIISLLLFMLAGTTSSALHHHKCPFKYLYHFGGAVTDVGNSMAIDPTVPAAFLPYGMTSGKPTGRWSDGLIDIDYAGLDFGFPQLMPYLSMNPSVEHDGVIFSVARSPVLYREFFTSRNISIPPYVAPMDVQTIWFKKYIGKTCPGGIACVNRLPQALVLFGDIEGNDLGYPLVQGKSIEEVKTYVPYVIQELIQDAREILKMGATRIIIPGNAPLGCWPYILTALQTKDPSAYDRLGCLKDVNKLVKWKNAELEKAVNKLQGEFPESYVNYAGIYGGAKSAITRKSLNGRVNRALKACCGSGGDYNYSEENFCGKDVPVCSDPNKYIFWDGLHFTQDTYMQMEHILIKSALVALNCTPAVN